MPSARSLRMPRKQIGLIETHGGSEKEKKAKIRMNFTIDKAVAAQFRKLCRKKGIV